MIIGIPVYEGVDLLDVTGPHEILEWMKDSDPSVEVRVIAECAGDVSTRAGGFTFKAPWSFADVPRLDVLWVPGGDPDALKALMTDPDRTYLDYLIAVSAGARYVASVCEGALLLAAAGLLDGYEATTHWAFIPCLRRFPKIKVVEGHPRFVVDRNRVTGGGISSGLQARRALDQLRGRPERAADHAVLPLPAGPERAAADGHLPVQLVAGRTMRSAIIAR
jgi:transcriptional regulator GlxA family with amidase domain